MKIRIGAEPGCTVSVGLRNMATGADGPTIEVSDGKVAELDIPDGFYAFATPHQTGEPPVLQPADPRILEEGQGHEDDKDVQAKIATDDDVRRIVSAKGDALTKTAGGLYQMESLNAALGEQGYQPINAARRDELYPPA